MNFPAARLALRPAQLARASHAGLLWAKALEALPNRGKKEDATAAKDALLTSIKSAVANSRTAYEPAFRRYKAALEALPNGEPFTAAVAPNQRLLIGMGVSTPLEIGLSLHHTYGVPYIPGSALKGIAAHYASRVWGEQSESDTDCVEWRKGGPHHAFIFGTQNQGGAIAFADAWITPECVAPCTLADDVITPHHREYYGAKANDPNPPPPADWDSPVPVPFLSVRDQTVFLSCIYSTLQTHTEAERNDIKGWLKITQTLLEAALREHGVGGKTSAGYGQMTLQGKNNG
jgi:CRISPR-associated protein Cmr6